jgi:lysophospholipase L1-like esterase
MFPGHFVSLAYGTNDANNGGVAPARFYANIKTMVSDVLSAGKVPVVPMIPYGCTTNLVKNVPRLNAEIKALYSAYPQIVHGPDFYTYFKHSRRLISGDCIHPSDPTGMQAYRTLYAKTMLTRVYNH